MSLIDPQPISGGDIQYVANMNLARVGSDEHKARSCRSTLSTRSTGLSAAGRS